MCQAGEFVPKAQAIVGISVDPLDGSYSRILTSFSSLGYSPIVYTHAQIEQGAPIADGVTVLVLSRVATLGAVTNAYVQGVLNYMASGGSVLGEYDGAALMFTDFSQPTAIVTNFSPSFGLVTGSVTGGGALLPLTNSTTYVADPNDPLMAGLPSSFIAGLRSGFAISGYNDNWLHASATFVSAGGTLPVGPFPAVLSGRCGGGRMALFTLNYLSATSTSVPAPFDRLIRNSVSWLIGN